MIKYDVCRNAANTFNVWHINTRKNEMRCIGGAVTFDEAIALVRNKSHVSADSEELASALRKKGVPASYQSYNDRGQK